MSSRIEIDRVPLELLGATSHPRAERLARRVRDAVAGALPAALAAACGEDLDDEPGYVFIDRLDVRCAIAAHWSDDAIGRSFARQVAEALGRARREGRAVVFSGREEYLAAYLAARLDGQVSSRWWFADFEGLAPLPLSSCLRTLLEVEGAAGWGALGRLTPETQRRVVAGLTVADARRVLESLPHDVAVPLPPTAALVAAARSRSAGVLPEGPHGTIAALAALQRARPGVPTARDLLAVQVIEALLTGADRSGLPPAAADLLPEAAILAWCDALGLPAAARAIVAELDCSLVVDQVTERMRAVPPPGPSSALQASFEHTPFGGALVLCLLLVRLGWWARWRDALLRSGAAQPDALAAWLALAVVSRALEPRRPSRVEQDPALRRVFGVSGLREPEFDRLARRLARRVLLDHAAALKVVAGHRLGPLLRASAQALLRECGARLPGCESATARYLRTQCLALSAAVAEDGTVARLGRAPLDVLLVLSGFKRADLVLPDGRPLTLREEWLP